MSKLKSFLVTFSTDFCLILKTFGVNWYGKNLVPKLFIVYNTM